LYNHDDRNISSSSTWLWFLHHSTFHQEGFPMVKIIADTTSCLSLAQAQARGIYYIPQIIVIGEETYRDDTEMTPIEFLKRQRVSPVLPKTAAPPPAMYNPIYEELLSQGHAILVITPSSQVSGTYRSAVVASQDFPGADIRVVDTQIIAGGMASVVLQAQEWADQGLDVDTIIQKVMEMCSRHRVYFMVDTLEFLYKGGRIGAAKALVGSLLQMKPILTFRNGQIESFDSQRTQKRAVARLKEVVLAECAHGPEGRLCLMHGDADFQAREIAQELAPILEIDAVTIPIYDLTAAILVHAGPGVLGAAFFVKG
jgi:DegV family protein with EDD domain